MIDWPTATEPVNEILSTSGLLELGADDIAQTCDDVEEAFRKIGFVQSLDQDPRLERAELARFHDDGAPRGDRRRELEADEERVGVPRGDEPRDADRLERDRRLAPAARPRHFLKRLLRGRESVDPALHEQLGEAHNAAVFFDHHRGQIGGARQSRLVETT